MRMLLYAGICCLIGCAAPQGWYKGEWSGTGKQIDGKSWDMRLVADVQWQIDYPSLACGGEWEMVSDQGNTLELRETILKGVNKCDQGNQVLVVRKGPHKMKVTFFNKALGYEGPIATGVLKKK